MASDETAEHDTHVARGELVDRPAPAAEGDGDAEERREAVEEPAKVMRIGSMIKQLLEETRTMQLDEPARDRLRDIYDTSVQELGAALSPDLREELDRLTLPFTEQEHPTDAELRVAKAQLVGWLEGLFHGIQATLFAQQMAARQQLDDMRRQLGPGQGGGPPMMRPGGPGGGGEDGDDPRPGVYL
jgi:hypothetical protein